MSLVLTFYGGVNEIGGNRILLEDGDTRLFLDFGLPFGRHGRFFCEFLNPRTPRGLLDPLALDLLPPLEGLYRDDLAAPGLWERFRGRRHYRYLARADGRPPVDGVLVSHAHRDHTGDIAYLDARIPIFASRATALLARAMQTTGQPGIQSEVTHLNPRVLNDDGLLAADRRSPHILRPYGFADGPLSAQAEALWLEPPSKTMVAAVPGAPVMPARVHCWPVDHSIPGATAWAAETSAGWVAYTGDLRFHGSLGPRTWEAIRAIAALRPAALLCEGTHIGYTSPHLTESVVAERALALVQRYAGRLVVADFAPRNIERLLTFLSIARETDRLLLVQPKDLYLLRALHLADAAAYPDPACVPCLAMYQDPKGSLVGWEKALRETWSGQIVSPVEVSADPGACILAFSLWDAADLLDLEGIAGGAYLFSNSRAYDDEQEADLQRLRNWVSVCGLTLHGDPDDANEPKLHASGHACEADLRRLVEMIRPGALIPVHTERADWWEGTMRGTGIAVRRPQMATPLRL